MLELLASVENWSFSIMLRETYLGFIVPLTMHSISMGFFVGSSILIALRVTGMASSIPLTSLARLMPLVWLALFFSVLSGLLLVLAYPAKALTNWVFYTKLLALASVVAMTFFFAKRLPQREQATLNHLSARTRLSAVLCIVLAVGVVTAGRFLAYTYLILMASESVLRG